MIPKNILGLLCCVILFVAGFALHTDLALYCNLSALLVVIGGSVGATLISYRLSRLAIACKVLYSSYRIPVMRAEEIVEILVDLSVKSRFKGILSLQEEEKTSILFLRRALGCLVDGYNQEQIRDILNTEMYFFKTRRDDCERVFRTMADFFPSFGLVGSVVGMIGMLSGIRDSLQILATIPIALTSTLYGIVFASFFCLPFAANLRERTNQELLLQKIITEGVIAIQGELDPHVLEIKLKSFLTPSLRAGRLVSIKRIQERFGIRAEASSPGTTPAGPAPPAKG